MTNPRSPGPLTGTRLRERRLGRGLRQSALAKMVGISPAYLNLIEHNRRRIGGKLLNDLARALGAEPAMFSEGAEAAALAQAQAAARRLPGVAAETERVEEFFGRFPGWAGLVAGQHKRIRELERLIETLSDRLTHDPHLAANLHEVLTTVTAIRSAVSILTEEGGVDPDWQARFLRNVAEDSARLAESASGLARFLEAGDDVDPGHLSPQEELGRFLGQNDFAFAALEPGGGGDIAALIGASDTLHSAAARDLAASWLRRYRADARAMPAAGFARAWTAAQGDPVRVAAHLGPGTDAVLRRAVCRPGAPALGLVSCDGSGTFTLRKPVAGFALPRFGAACPRWPLFQALGIPGRVLRQRVAMPGPAGARFDCIALATLDYPDGAAGLPVVQATMLIRPEDAAVAQDAGTGVVEVGTGCRICPRQSCAARREMSILTQAG